MTQEAKQFNARYNLEISDSSFKTTKIKEDLSNDLPGKPKRNITEVLKRFSRNYWAMAMLAVFIIIVLLAIILPFTTPYSPNGAISRGGATNSATTNLLGSHLLIKEWKDSTEMATIDNINKLHNGAIPYHLIQVFNGQTLIEWHPYDLVNAQDAKHNFHHFSVMGTDGEMRDIWTRTWAGTWASLKLALLVVTITTVIGTIVGSWIGLYVGTIIDILFMKIIAIYGSIPTIVWYAMILFVMPPGYWSLVTIFIVTGWMGSLGTSRMFMWKYVNQDFMKAAETYGVSKLGRIIKHAIPNYLGIILLGFVASIPGIIEGEASLAFLGFSPSPDAASLGNVLNEAQAGVRLGGLHIWYLLVPTIIIFTMTISLKYVAFGLNDAINPKFEGR